ncbi:MAG: helix-turn-helix domain-containing protein [Bacteroidota bacterium]
MKYTRDKKAIELFGKQVMRLRKQQKISQKQLAFESNISDTQIRRIEKGEIATGISTIFAIARALDIHVKELFEFEMP